MFSLNVFLLLKFGPFFFGYSLDWKRNNGFSWCEILAGYVRSFDSSLNRFWFALTGEVLWFLWKERNKEIFKNVRRPPTEFNLKLTNFYIMSQVSLLLEIIEPRFMKLMHDGTLLV